MPNTFEQTGPDVGQSVVSGLQNFSDQVNKLAMRQSLQNAQMQIDAINDSTDKEFERHQAYRQVGQQLAFQLAGAGADASHIQTLLGAIPKAAPPPQNALEGMTSEDPRVVQATKDFEALQQKNKIEQLKTTGDFKLASAGIAAQAKKEAEAAKEQRAAESAFKKDIMAFGQSKDVAPLITGQDQVETAQKQLSQAKKNPQAFVSAAIHALRAAGLTRITEFELKKMGGAYGLVNNLAKMSAESLGQVSDAQIHAVQKVLDVISESNKSQLAQKARDYSSAQGTSPGSKFTPQQYYMQLHQKHNLGAYGAMPEFDAAGRIAAPSVASVPPPWQPAQQQPQSAPAVAQTPPWLVKP